jgi:hypothetical protein
MNVSKECSKSLIRKRTRQKPSPFSTRLSNESLSRIKKMIVELYQPKVAEGCSYINIEKRPRRDSNTRPPV